MAQAGAASESGEVAQYWRQLALAGLIEGTYSGMAGAGSNSHCVVGTDCPRSKLATGGWAIRNIAGYFPGNGSDWAGTYGIFLDMGAGSTTGSPQGAILRPEEAWNIDTKMDDGRPGTGSIIVATWTGCSTAASATDFAASYRLDNTNVACILHFMRVF